MTAVRQTSGLLFLVLSLVWTSLFWAGAARWNSGGDPMDSLLFVVGGSGPLILAVALTQFREARSTRRDFWIRTVDLRRIRRPWLAVSLFLHPALIGLAFAADSSLGASPPALVPESNSVWAILSLLVVVFWFGPVPEELAWRGFALDRLQDRMSALQASLVLGAAWALWHVPLFFIPGTFQAGLEFGSQRSLVFLSSMVPLSVLMTWVYNNTERSTLSAILVHFSGNLCGALFAKTDRVAGFELAFLGLASVLVTLGCGARRLTSR